MARESKHSATNGQKVRVLPQGTKNKRHTAMTHPDTRIIDLTVAQLAEVINKAVEDSLRRRQQPEQQRRLVYGIKGIAEIFGVSERQARYIKASGQISKAIRQQGRTIVTDADLALQLFGKHS